MIRPRVLLAALLVVGASAVLVRAQLQNFAALAGQSFAQGLAEVVRSASQNSMRPSLAAIDQQTATSMSYDNQIKQTVTFFEKRKLNRMYREQEKSPPASRSDLASYAKARAPDRASPRQLDSYTGRIQWPVVLQGQAFARQRQELEQLYAKHAAAGGGINTAEYAEIQRVATGLEADLKKQLQSTTPEQYMYARKFLASLRYEARFPSDA